MTGITAMITEITTIMIGTIMTGTIEVVITTSINTGFIESISDAAMICCGIFITTNG
ncbi:MAG: hypothetical protein ABI472_06640 [Ginsengibacter sp.]